MNEFANATRSLVLEREMPHPPEKVWRALTQGPLIEAWLMQNDFEPVVGRAFNFRARPMPHWNGAVDSKVLAVAPCTLLSYEWNASGVEAMTGFKTVITWTLTPTENGTLLRMEQSGFRVQDEFNYQGAGYGWRRYIMALEELLGRMDGTSETAPTKSIVVERRMPHAPEKIWRALTVPEAIAEWLMQNDFAPAAGHRFTFRATPVPGWSGVTHCEVIEADAPKRLVYRWGDGTESDSGLQTLVTWTLTPVDGGTAVRMEQSGFRPQDERGYQGMGGGWPRIVGNLERIAGVFG